METNEYLFLLLKSLIMFVVVATGTILYRFFKPLVISFFKKEKEITQLKIEIELQSIREQQEREKQDMLEMKSMHKDLLLSVNNLITEFRNNSNIQTELKVNIQTQGREIKELKENQTEIFRRINEK